MKRRGVLGFLGGAVVAGPGMAKAAVAQGLEGLSLSPLGAANGIIGAGYASQAGTGDPVGPDNYDPIGWAKRDLANFFGKSAAQLLRERQGITVHALDPDLASMRSLSLDAKVRIQRERIFQRNQMQERGWIEQRIEDLIKQNAA